MRKYYVVIMDIGPVSGERYQVSISDSPKGAVYEFEAKNFEEAQAKVLFVKNLGGQPKLL